jgi:hypothetical protein
LDGGSDFFPKCGFEGNLSPPDDIDRCELSLQNGDDDFHAYKGTADNDKFFSFFGG